MSIFIYLHITSLSSVFSIIPTVGFKNGLCPVPPKFLLTWRAAEDMVQLIRHPLLPSLQLPVGATVDSPKMNWWTCTNCTR